MEEDDQVITIYDSVDISESIDVVSAKVFDSAGGAGDRIELTLSDAWSKWEMWKPTKGSLLELRSGGYSSGVMRIDQLRQPKGFVVLEAVSISEKARSIMSRTWENTKFSLVADDLCKAAGFKYSPLNIIDLNYERIDQRQAYPLEFLQYLCEREGYNVKLESGFAYVYDVRQMESAPAVAIVDYADTYEFDFLDKSVGLYKSCEVKHSGTSYSFTFTHADIQSEDILRIDTYLCSDAEAERFSRNFLKNYNSQERTLKITIRLNTGVAGGNTLEVKNAGIASGKYFVIEACHDIALKESTFWMVGILEGY